MAGMFYGASIFNSNISNWDVARVSFINVMFNSASSFNQNLCPWGPKLPSNLNYAIRAEDMFASSGCLNKNSPTGRTGPWCAVTTCTA